MQLLFQDMVKSIVAFYESQEKNGHNFRFFINLRRKLSSENFCRKRHSCFISYSTKNQDFAERLHSKMQGKGLRVWFSPEDIQGGKKLHEQIDEAIRVYDKLLLVLSPESMNSEWVKTEIRKARKAEIKEKGRKLFPIRLIDFKPIEVWELPDSSGEDLAEEVRKFFIPDFSNWKDHDSFESAFARLLRDLKAEESTGAKPG